MDTDIVAALRNGDRLTRQKRKTSDLDVGSINNDRHNRASRYFHLVIVSDGSFDSTLIRKSFEERFQSHTISIEIGIDPYRLPDVLGMVLSEQPDAIAVAISDHTTRKSVMEFLGEDTACAVISADVLGVQPGGVSEAESLARLVTTMDANLDRAWGELLGEVKISREALLRASEALSASTTIGQRVEALSRDVSRLDESVSSLHETDTQILLRDAPQNWLEAIGQNKTTILLGALVTASVYLVGTAGLFWGGVIDAKQAQQVLRWPLQLVGLEGSDD